LHSSIFRYDMKRHIHTRMLITVGSVVLAYWLIFYLYVFQDWYLDNLTVGLILKITMPVAVIIDVAGLIFGCIAAANRRRGGSMVIALYGAPLLAAGGFFWWLFFGVKI